MKQRTISNYLKSNVFNGKVVLITGASKGIGRAIAIAFVKCGAKVIANYNSSYSEAMQLQKTFGDDNIDIVRADVSDEIEVKKMVEYIQAKYDHVDVLVNNAGVIKRSKSWTEIQLNDWQETLSVNAIGTWLVTKMVYPLMESKGGSIVNISSIYGLSPNAKELAYSCSKSMIISMTLALAKELAPNIRVNAICPGNTITDMVPDMHTMRCIEELTCLKRSADVDEISNAVLMLASDCSSYITGCVLPVDGGYCLKG